MSAPTLAQPSIGDRVASFCRDHRSLLLIVALAFVLRLAWFLYSRPIVLSDFRQYLESAQVLRQHGQYGYPTPTAHRLPLYPVLLAGLLLVSSRVAWLSLWSVLLSTAICPLLYVVGRRVGLSLRAALIAALIYAVVPNFVFYTPVLASEYLLAILVLSAFVVASGHRFHPPVRFLVVGILIGAATLTRGDGLVYGVIALVWGIATMRSESTAAHATPRCVASGCSRSASSSC